MEKEKLLVFGSEQLKKDYIDRTLTSIEIEPSEYDRVIKAPEGYNGFNEIIVKGARLQQKLVTPTKEMQQIFADEGYYGLSDVIVSPPIVDGESILNAVNGINKVLGESYIGGNTTANDLLKGKIAYSKSEKIYGAIETYNEPTDIEVSSGGNNRTITLLTENKYLNKNINIKINPNEEIRTSYHSLKDILDSDTENYQYKIMQVFGINRTSIYLRNGYLPTAYKLSNGELVTEITSNSTITLSLNNVVSVYNEMLNMYEDFIYVISYTDSYEDYIKQVCNYGTFWYNSATTLGSYEKYLIINVDFDYRIMQENATTNAQNVTIRRPILNSPYFLSVINNTTYQNFQEINDYTINFDTDIDISDTNNNYIIPTLSFNPISKNSILYINIEGEDKEKCKVNYILLRNCKGVVSNRLVNAHLITDTNYVGSLFASFLNTIINIDLYGKNFFSNASLSNMKPNFINLRLFNINSNLILGSTTYGYNLTFDSIIHTIQQLIDVNASRTLTIGSINMAKVENTYVRLIDITDEMYQEDEYVMAKLPCEVCESTDEGAMLITDYMALKQWSLA